MKKKILFIISNMESGGVSKSMSNLLNVIDTNRYDVDCLIVVPQGIFMDTIPKNINLIYDKKTELFFLPFPRNLFRLLTKGLIYTAFLRLLAAILMKINKGWGGFLLSKGIVKLSKEYDLAVDYNGQQQLYYLIDNVKAKKKATFFHSDYAKWPYYYSMDKKYMPKADKIFTISNHCVQSLKDFFPKQTSKIELFENISSSPLILKMANASVPDPLDSSFFNLITIGHVSEAKGSHWAIGAAKLLKSKGISFKWYFLGNNPEEKYFNTLSKKAGVSESIIFMGLKQNPYPYLKQANLVVHPSSFEGKSITLDEAKILCKPIVVTNFSTVYDQFENKVNASICDMTAEDLADKIEELFLDINLRSKYINHLEINRVDNTSEIKKLEAIFNSA